MTALFFFLLVSSAAFAAWRMMRKGKPRKAESDEERRGREKTQEQLRAEHWEGVFNNYWSGGRK